MPDPAIVEAVQKVMSDYTQAFLTGTREDAQAFVHLPVVYISESDVQLRDRYPFDPEKFRQVTGVAHTEMDVEVVHADATKAHAVIKGVRQNAAGEPVEQIESFYILQDRGDGWKIAAFSGVRTPLDNRRN